VSWQACAAQQPSYPIERHDWSCVAVNLGNGSFSQPLCAGSSIRFRKVAISWGSALHGAARFMGSALIEIVKRC